MNFKLNVVAKDLLVDKANLLTLPIPETTVLVDELRVLGANYNSSKRCIYS